MSSRDKTTFAFSVSRHRIPFIWEKNSRSLSLEGYRKSDMSDRSLYTRTRRPGRRPCLGCHSRKIRCDREIPCRNCSRHGLSCIYPTRDNGRRQELTLQCVSDRLERLETLVSRFSEDRTAEAVRNDSEAQVEPEGNQASDLHRSHSWEVLLGDGQSAQYVNNSNIKDLLQNVGCQLFSLMNSRR